MSKSWRKGKSIIFARVEIKFKENQMGRKSRKKKEKRDLSAQAACLKKESTNH